MSAFIPALNHYQYHTIISIVKNLWFYFRQNYRLLNYSKVDNS